MNSKMTFALAMLLAVASTALDAAPAKEKEAAPAEAAAEGPTPAQLKARKAKKPIYMKAVEAFKAAEAAAQPVLAFIFIDQNPASDFLEKKVLTNKLFRDDLAKDNVVLLKIKVKHDQGGKDPKTKGKKIDLRGLKEKERKIVENFGLDEKAAAQAAKADKPELTYLDAVNYPAVICLSPDGSKQIFRMGRFDSQGGMGVWISTVADTLRAAGFEPVVSPKLQKVLDNPDDPKKWK